MAVQKSDGRILRRGENVLREEKPPSAAARFLEQLASPLIYILMAAAAVSALLGEFGDTAVIVAVIALNGIIGVVQEGRAEKALEALKKLSSPQALIKEGGQVRQVPAAKLIPGDVVCLEAGSLVPADLRLTLSCGLRISEAALTGESVPVGKARGDEAFMSTTVSAGRGEGVVTRIGMDTRIGSIAGLLKPRRQEKTPLQKRLGSLGRLLSALSLALCALLFVLAVLQKRDVLEMLITAISLAVAAVPEGLPAIVAMVLALSVSRMAKAHTIVRRLGSVETLGCVSVVCSDKTGTLTQNKMTVARCFLEGRVCGPGELSSSRDGAFLRGFALCSDAVLPRPDAAGGERLGDPTELALLDMAAAHGIYRDELERSTPRVDEIAFDSARKMMTTVQQDGKRRIAYTKGSPDEILNRCGRMLLEGRERSLGRPERERIQTVLRGFTDKGLRVLALAMKEDSGRDREKDMTFVGMAAMKDPARPEAAGAVEEFRRAGVRTVMITGDRKDTAFAIAAELGIAKNRGECVTGEEMDAMSDEALKKRLPSVRVFAHVSPEHKVRIVAACKAAGETVAMTGDGVNDAPSLRAADVGIAMGITGTDVAKGAADMVLTDDNFATIARAIALGRSIYENIRKAVLFLLSSNFGEMITMLAAIAFGFPSPLKASHILWINLITDSLPALALGVDENGNRNDMNRPPRSRDEGLFDEGGLGCVLLYGVLIALISLGAFLKLPLERLPAEGLAVSAGSIRLLMADPGFLNRCQTYAFTVLGLSQLFHAVGMRDTETSVFRMNHWRNKMMLAAFAVGVGLQLMVTEIPYFVGVFGTSSLSPGEWLMLTALSAAPLLAHELLVLFSTAAKKPN